MAKRRPGRDPEEHSTVKSSGHHKTEHHKSELHKSDIAKKEPEPIPQDAAAETADSVEMHVVDVESGVRNNKSKTHRTELDATHSEAEASHSSVSSHDDAEHAANEDAKEETKVELNFVGSEMLRAQFPKAFETAEKIATDWVSDGRFEGLPLGHPLAQYFAAKGLRKAKEVEKKVMESPVTEKVAMNILTYGMKAQEIINQVKAKVKK